MIRLANASTSNAKDEEQVKIVPFYDKHWNLILRPPKELANGIAFIAEKLCNNNYVLYSQAERLTLNERLRQSGYNLNYIDDKVYCDCSSFVATCINGAGKYVDVTAFTTSTMRSMLKAIGFQAIDFEDKSQLQKGDILVKEGSHTVIVLSVDNEVVEEPKNEFSKFNGKVRLNDINSYLNVREKPSTNSKVIFTLNHGESVEVISQTSNWYLIESESRRGYCSSNYIKDEEA